jgi:hypothetical protein
MSETKTPLEQALDLFFYAPLGFLMNASEVIPDLVQKGRQQAMTARMFGEFAVKTGQQEAGKQAARLSKQASVAVNELRNASARRPAAPPRPARPSAPASPSRAEAPSASPPPASPSSSSPSSPASSSSSSPSSNGPASGDLPIPDYDSLAASQVVPRLEALSRLELAAVRAYETANRGRKTILNKIAQLQG